MPLPILLKQLAYMDFLEEINMILRKNHILISKRLHLEVSE